MPREWLRWVVMATGVDETLEVLVGAGQVVDVSTGEGMWASGGRTDVSS